MTNFKIFTILFKGGIILYVPEIDKLEKIEVEKRGEKTNLIKEILLVMPKVMIHGKDGSGGEVSGASAAAILGALEKEGVWDYNFDLKFRRAIETLIDAGILRVTVVWSPTTEEKVFALEPKIYLPP